MSQKETMTSITRSTHQVNHPRYHPRRDDRGLAYDLEVREVKRAMFQGWEREWAADGTLAAVGMMYVPVDGDGHELAAPAAFCDALLVIWENNQQGPKPGHSLKAVQS